MISNTSSQSYKKTILFVMDPKFNETCKRNNDLVFSFEGITKVPRKNLNIIGIKKNIYRLENVDKINFGNSFSTIFNTSDIFKIKNVNEITFHFDKNMDDPCYNKILSALISPFNIHYRNNIKTIKIMCNNDFILRSTANWIDVSNGIKSNTYSLNNNHDVSQKINYKNVMNMLTNPLSIQCRFCLDLKYGCEWCNDDHIDKLYDDEYEYLLEHMNDCDGCGENDQDIDEYGLCFECRRDKKIKKIRRENICDISNTKTAEIMKNKKFISFN